MMRRAFPPNGPPDHQCVSAGKAFWMAVCMSFEMPNQAALSSMEGKNVSKGSHRIRSSPWPALPRQTNPIWTSSEALRGARHMAWHVSSACQNVAGGNDCRLCSRYQSQAHQVALRCRFGWNGAFGLHPRCMAVNHIPSPKICCPTGREPYPLTSCSLIHIGRPKSLTKTAIFLRLRASSRRHTSK